MKKHPPKRARMQFLPGCCSKITAPERANLTPAGLVRPSGARFFGRGGPKVPLRAEQAAPDALVLRDVQSRLLTAGAAEIEPHSVSVHILIKLRIHDLST